MLPPLNPDTGLLPPGIHNARWQEVVQRFGWNPQRAAILQQLRLVLTELARAGCRAAYIDGSLVTVKEHPSDFDMCWDPDGVDIDALDPVLLKFDDGRRAMKNKYGGDIFVTVSVELRSGRTFIDFFQVDKVTGNPKGIVKLIPQEAL